MKQVSTDLLNHLSTEQNFISCDMYEFVFVNGEHFYFCDFDIDVTYQGHIYLHNACLVKRTNTEIASNLVVDKLSLTIYCDERDQHEGTPILHMARNGGLDNATLVCTRAFMNERGDIIGAVKLFDGMVEVRSGGGMQLKLDIKSKVQLFNVEWPQRRYYPTCAFSLYSTACGVNAEDYVVFSRITSVEDSAHFAVTLNGAKIKGGLDGYFTNGVVQFLTGPLVGKDATIKSNSGERITLLVSEEAMPTVGDMVKLYPGCDKTNATCRSKFNNTNRDRATPYVPLKESVI